MPVLGTVGCAGDGQDSTFPQGIASFDPTPEGVLLWTRVEGGGPVRYEVATDPDFREIVADGEQELGANSDGTLRVEVTLAAGTTYWYRFVAHGVTSPVGRTRTAPPRDADVRLRIGLTSCQDFGGRWFHAWRALVDRDDIDVVLFIGDYIYETIGHLGETASDDRTIELPDGLVLEDPIKGHLAALTLADYRALYRQYRRDPDLRAAHAHFPFIMLWDDHEFANDCWREHATDFDDYYGDEGNLERRDAATRAWHEFNPSRRTGESEIYRSLRWGRHAELVLLDERAKRDDHLVPEGPIDREVGHIMENSAFGSRTFVIKDAFDTREQAAAPTMLGEAQRTWAIETVTASTATWKVVASPLIMAQMVLDLSAYERLPDMFRNRFYFKTDQWDGFRSERRALLEACAAVENVVVLSGDLHGFYAAELHADFDAPGGEPLAVEFGVSAICAATVDVQLQAVVDANPFLEAFGLGDLIPEFDTNLLATNPHIRHADSVRNGFAIVELGPDAVDVQFVPVGDVRSPSAAKLPPEVAFRTRAGTRRIEVL